MNKKIIIGNFKMNLLPNEVVLYIENLKKDIKSNNEIVLCVPYVDIPYASNIVNDTNIYVGAQNMYSREEGAYTGEISVKMLKSIKTDYVLLGHYERRLYFNETEEEINKKLILALKYNIKPIVCIGSNESLENEINMILKDIKKESINNIIFIYEPVFSVGTGNLLDKNEIIDKIKNENNEIYIITARSSSKWDDVNGEMNNILISWLNNNNIKYDKLIVSKEKLEICKNYKIDIMIEDKVENINNISKEIPVVCFNASYNKSCTSDNIYRAYSWYDVYYNIIYKIMVN